LGDFADRLVRGDAKYQTIEIEVLAFVRWQRRIGGEDLLLLLERQTRKVRGDAAGTPIAYRFQSAARRMHRAAQRVAGTRLDLGKPAVKSLADHRGEHVAGTARILRHVHCRSHR
jgi:hypothetical protein